jgi:hypothetical protein
MCWACDSGINPVGIASAALPLNPLGTCWGCHVAACKAHARRDPGAGKWLCYLCVNAGLAASSGIDAADSAPISFESSSDFEHRFPTFAGVTAERREYWRSGGGEGRLGRYRTRHPEVTIVEWGLAADAIATAEHLEVPQLYVDSPDLLFVSRFPTGFQYLPPKLAMLIRGMEDE